MLIRKVQKINAEGMSVGRLASQVASMLRGKNKPEYRPNVDAGDIVEILNINKVAFTGKKIEQKKYFRYSGYRGGMKEIKMSDVFSDNPGDILKRAVTQMLPANKLRDGMVKRLIIK